MIVFENSIFGAFWLFTPKIGRPGYVEPGEIQDAAG